MRDGPLRVLWLGRVNLRKGIQYLVEAAGEMEDDLLQFDVVGPLKITEEVVDQAPSNMTFHGRVPRDEVSDYYRNADVFVLPTLSDGFAITQLEAMAHGLPVVTTPNCGRVVTDGEDGWIIPPRDSDVLAETLADCARHRAQLHQMAERAHATSKQYTLGRVADALRSIPPAA
nr:glycosyltransferase family 4 protein [Salinibacter ruber]